MNQDSLARHAKKYIEKEFVKRQNKKRALGEKKYLKSPWKFYGLSTPLRRKIVKRALVKYPDLTKEGMLKLVVGLWNTSYHEEKSAAIMVLGKYSHILTAEDLDLVEKLIDSATGWDHLDELCATTLSCNALP